MKTTRALLSVICMVFLSCDRPVYKKTFSDFPDNQWKKEDVKTFEFEIAEEARYDVFIDFSHVYGMPFATVPIELVIEKPRKTVTSQDLDIILSNADGLVSDCSGDYCDVRQKVVANAELPNGKYRIAIINKFDYPYLPNVTAIGLRVVKSGQ